MNKPSKAGSKVKNTFEAHKVPGTIGLDVGDRLSYFCVLSDEGQVVAEGRVATSKEAMQHYLAGLAPSRIALECGTHSGWLSRLAGDLGHEVIVANPRELRKIHQSNRKNDRADAQILARMARVDPKLLAPIQHRSAQMQADLAMIRARDILVRTRTKWVNAVRGLVKATGSRLPKCSTHSFARQVLDQVPEELHEALHPLITSIASLSEKITQYDRKIEALADEQYPQTKVLRQITGVGALTAATFVLTLADPGRFTKSRDVGACLGLAPRQDDSGDRISQLPITKAGDEHLRRLLVGCAQYIVGPFGPDCDLRRFGERLMQRGGKNAKKRAVVAVARKLGALLHYLWSTGSVYDPLHNANKNAKELQAA